MFAWGSRTQWRSLGLEDGMAFPLDEGLVVFCIFVLSVFMVSFVIVHVYHKLIVLTKILMCSYAYMYIDSYCFYVKLRRSR